MKFQNPSFIFFERTDEQTDRRTDKPKAIGSPLFQSWGHKEIHNHVNLIFTNKRWGSRDLNYIHLLFETSLLVVHRPTSRYKP